MLSGKVFAIPSFSAGTGFTQNEYTPFVLFTVLNGFGQLASNISAILPSSLRVTVASVTGSNVVPSRIAPVKVKKLKVGFNSFSADVWRVVSWKGRFVVLTMRMPSIPRESISA